MGLNVTSKLEQRNLFTSLTGRLFACWAASSLDLIAPDISYHLESKLQGAPSIRNKRH